MTWIIAYGITALATLSVAAVEHLELLSYPPLSFWIVPAFQCAFMLAARWLVSKRLALVTGRPEWALGSQPVWIGFAVTHLAEPEPRWLLAFGLPLTSLSLWARPLPASSPAEALAWGIAALGAMALIAAATRPDAIHENGGASGKVGWV